jgi:hypothetical protein
LLIDQRHTGRALHSPAQLKRKYGAKIVLQYAGLKPKTGVKS